MLRRMPKITIFTSLELICLPYWTRPIRNDHQEIMIVRQSTRSGLRSASTRPAAAVRHGVQSCNGATTLSSPIVKLRFNRGRDKCATFKQLCRDAVVVGFNTFWEGSAFAARSHKLREDFLWALNNVLFRGWRPGNFIKTRRTNSTD